MFIIELGGSTSFPILKYMHAHLEVVPLARWQWLRAVDLHLWEDVLAPWLRLGLSVPQMTTYYLKCVFKMFVYSFCFLLSILCLLKC